MFLETWAPTIVVSSTCTILMTIRAIRVHRHLRKAPKCEEGYTHSTGPRL